MSDPLDTDPDDILEPDEPEGIEPTPQRGKPPEVSVPEVPTPGGDQTDGDGAIAEYSDVNPELRREFGRLVIVIKFSLLSLTLGSLFVIFEGRYTLGGQLLALGTAVTIYGIYKFRTVKAGLDSGRFETDEAEEENETDEAEEKNSEAEKKSEAIDADGETDGGQP